MTHADSTKSWVVVVCPDDSSFHRSFRSAAGGMFPNGASFSGRTALLDSGGRISVVPVSASPTFVVGPFSVMFRGWDEDLAADSSRMSVWRAAAKRVIL